jgi:hypothetical protein
LSLAGNVIRLLQPIRLLLAERQFSRRRTNLRTAVHAQRLVSTESAQTTTQHHYAQHDDGCTSSTTSRSVDDCFTTTYYYYYYYNLLYNVMRYVKVSLFHLFIFLSIRITKIESTSNTITGLIITTNPASRPQNSIDSVQLIEQLELLVPDNPTQLIINEETSLV